MKNFIQITIIAMVIFFTNCEKKQVGIEPNEQFQLVGEWEEKFPELHDGIADTLVFTEDNIVKEHFFFDGFNYEERTDTIIIFQDENIRKYFFEIISPTEMIIYHFLDRASTASEKDIHYQKIKK
ncbi:hypothetical protein [Portibacter marinus]|uniref:hypothetical protein n=1 Tax=Portibacter marinus TaxID=2898660 RepID=UPI001F427214|nr:hypothetical protein [Portibacter marinus]